jgi:hypothetical protein
LWVVGVPGIREYRPGADAAAVQELRASQWRRALKHAVDRGARRGGARPQILVNVVLYGGLLHRRAPVAQGVVDDLLEDDLQGPGALLEPAVAGLLQELTAAGSPLEALHRWSEAVRLSPGEALRYAQTHLADLAGYLACGQHLADPPPAGAAPDPGAACGCRRRAVLRDLVAQTVRDVDREGTVADVVIGRDLGAVIAYEALCRPSMQDVPVPLLLTVGAPLGLTAVHSRLDPAPHGGGLGRWPGSVQRWIDVRSPADALRCRDGVDPSLADRFEREVTDRVVDGGGHGLLDDDAYLDCDAVGEILRELAGPPRVRTIDLTEPVDVPPGSGS